MSNEISSPLFRFSKYDTSDYNNRNSVSSPLLRRFPPAHRHHIVDEEMAPGSHPVSPLMRSDSYYNMKNNASANEEKSTLPAPSSRPLPLQLASTVGIESPLQLCRESTEERYVRRPPVARLEELGGSQTWCLLLLPLLLFALTLPPLPAILTSSSVTLSSLASASPSSSRFTSSTYNDTFTIQTSINDIQLAFLEVTISPPASSLHFRTLLQSQENNDRDAGNSAVIIDTYYSTVDDSPFIPLAYLDLESLVTFGDESFHSNIVIEITSETILTTGIEVYLSFRSIYMAWIEATLPLLLVLITVITITKWVFRIRQQVHFLKTQSHHSRLYQHRSFLECLLPEQVIYFITPHVDDLLRYFPACCYSGLCFYCGQ